MQQAYNYDISSSHSIADWCNKIIKGNAIAALEQIPSNSIDIIFADPPYNLQLSSALYRPDNSQVDAVNAHWDQFESFEAYDAFTKAWMLACRRILKPQGTIWVIGSYHNIFRVGSLMQDLGYWLLNDVIWRKTNPMPNFRGRRFQNAHETLIWASKSKKEASYTFNYDALKAANDDVQMRSDWVFPICTGKERLKNDDGKKLHPTQKPEALLARIIMACTKPGDIVLDPFFGTGTTGAVAKKLGRNFVGFEKEQEYINAAQLRIDNVKPYNAEELASLKPKKSEPRVAFLQLIETNIIKVGQYLYDSKKQHKALIKADGTILCNEFVGSIHSVGKSLQNAQSCNGWTYWYIEQNNQLVSIDELRNLYRKRSA